MRSLLIAALCLCSAFAANAELTLKEIRTAAADLQSAEVAVTGSMDWLNPFQ